LAVEKYLKYVPSFAAVAAKKITGTLPIGNATIRRAKKLMENADLTPEERILGYFHWLPVETVRKLFNHTALRSYDPDIFMRQLFRETGADESYLNKLLYIEQKSFLVDHNLNYTDKMSMAVGVEARVPFLDLELVAFAASLPVSLKIKNGETKYLLKKVAERYLPHDVIYRPKTGFGAPVRKWITSDLSGRIEESFRPGKKSAMANIFDMESVRELVQRNKEGKMDASYSIWGLLAIDSWMQQFIEKRN
jgi:asparagine synthase (glutamine-hydrolysing)